MNKTPQQKLTALRAEIEELRKDKERLDWLQTLVVEGQVIFLKELNFVYDRSRKSLRTAIDAARKEKE
jgi:hypothetical protein